MMQAEFEALIGKEVDCAMYSELVEPVYMYHPGITHHLQGGHRRYLQAAAGRGHPSQPAARGGRVPSHGRRGQQAARADRPTDGQTQRHQAAAEAAFE